MPEQTMLEIQEAPWEGWPACPCGCGSENLKLLAPLRKGPWIGEQHVRGCRCRSHIAKRNRKSGQGAQAVMHLELGGTGFTPTHEESARTYTVEVHPESKQGAQVPASLKKFLETDWYRRALNQSVRSLPFGSRARPAVWVQLPGGRKVLIVDYGGGRDR